MEPRCIELLRRSHNALGEALALLGEGTALEATRDEDAALVDAVELLSWSSQVELPGQVPAPRSKATSHFSAVLPSAAAVSQRHGSDDDSSSEPALAGGRTTQLFVEDTARCSLELHCAPQWMDRETLQRCCSTSFGDPSVVISRPGAAGSRASWVLEFSSEKTKIKFRQLFDRLRLGLRVSGTMFTQHLSPYECNARGLPKPINFDDTTDFITKSLFLVGMAGVIGGMLARSFLGAGVARWVVILSYMPGTISLMIQAFASVCWSYAAVLLIANPKSLGLSPVPLTIICAMLAPLSVAARIFGQRWSEDPLFVQPSFTLFLEALSEDNRPHIRSSLRRVQACTLSAYLACAAGAVCLAWSAEAPQVVEEQWPGAKWAMSLSVFLYAFSMMSVQIRGQYLQVLMNTCLRQLMRDSLEAASFAPLKSKFIKLWQLEARLAHASSGEAMIVLVCLSFCCMFTLLQLWSISRQIAQLSEDKLYMGFLLGAFACQAVAIGGLFHLLWKHGSVASMFSETLCMLQRRHFVVPFVEVHPSEVADFLVVCSSPWVQSNHPRGHVVAGIVVTKERVVRLLYLYVYAVILFSLKNLVVGI